MNNPLQLAISIITRFGEEAGDSPEVRLQKTLLTAGCFMIVPAAALWGIIYMAFGETLAGSISLSYSTLTVLSLLIFRLTRRCGFILFTQLAMGLLFPFLQTVILGGFANSSAVILWSLISPLGALLFYENRIARLWWSAYIILVVIGAILQPFLRVVNNLPLGLIVVFFLLNIAAVSSIAFITLNYFISEKNRAYQLLHIEEQKSETLLLNVLPREIAAILKNENRTIADHFDGVSILFADLVGFTPLTAKLAPVEMVNLLNEIFSFFDSLVEKYDLEKIRTIGDNYMVASGVPRRRPDHAEVLARMALEMNAYLHNHRFKDGECIEFRMGMNSGPVVGGVIGKKKFAYDLWGDVVNIASRMESQGVAGKIQISPATYRMIESKFICDPRGEINVKGRGEMPTWFLVGEKSPTS